MKTKESLFLFRDEVGPLADGAYLRSALPRAEARAEVMMVNFVGKDLPLYTMWARVRFELKERRRHDSFSS